MIENIEAIYKNGVLRPLKPLDLPEGKTFKIDVRDVSETSEENAVNADKIKAFDEWMATSIRTRLI